MSLGYCTMDCNIRFRLLKADSPDYSYAKNKKNQQIIYVLEEVTVKRH